MYLNYDYSYDAVIKSNARQWEVFRFNVLQNGSWINIKIPNKIKSFTISDYSTDGSNITMGSVAGSKIILNLKDMTSSDAKLFNEGSRFYMSLNVSDPNVHEYYSQLTSVRYVVDSVVKKKKANGNYEMTITAYDYSYAMTDEYVASSENLTALQVVTEIATKYGLTVDSSVSDKIRHLGTSFSSMTFTPLQGFTCKQTLGYMAGCFGCFARINSALKVCFEWYETATDSLIGKDRIYADSLSYKEERTIQLLETGTKDNPIVVPDNASGHSINFENPYITKELAEAIYDKKIKGGLIHYSVGKVRYKGNPVNMSGKIVTTTDITGNTTPFYIMKRTLNFDGGLSETIECLGESETTINFKITSPTQQKINRALSRMEEAIKKATDIITQTKGSIFEVIPIDENDPSKGNSGWKLYSTEIGRNNLIMANSSGIGFSSNGGQSFNAMAMYIDENGIGHINANCIDVGKLSANVIDTSTLVVGKENVDGLDSELKSLLQAAEDAETKANTAQDTATTAQNTADTANSTANTANSNASSALSTANTASTNASSALSVANSVNGVIANWCYESDVTYIDGGTIYTGTITAKQIAAESITADKLAVGAITAEKVNVGWQSGNCATGWTSNKISYFEISSDSDYNYNPKILMTSSYTSDNIDINGIPFYASAGDVLRFGGRAYKRSAGDNGVYLKYSLKSDGTYSVVDFENTANKSTGTITDIDKSYTVTNAGWYMITVAFNRQASGAYVTNLYCYKDVKGEMIVNGRISSVDKQTYFDLDTGEVALKSTNANYSANFNSAKLEFSFMEYQTGGIEGWATNNSIVQRRLSVYSPNYVEIGIGNSAENASGTGFILNKSELGIIPKVVCQKNLKVNNRTDTGGYIEMTSDNENGGTLYMTREDTQAWGYLYLSGDGHLYWSGSIGTVKVA